MKTDVIKSLEILGFIESEEVPKLKLIKKNYLKLLKEKHPDKNGGIDRGLDELIKAFEVVSKYVMENIIDDGEDEEESSVRKEFTDINIVQLNVSSATVKPPTAHEQSWEKILQKHYGDPVDSSAKGHGKKYSAPNGVFVTAYYKSKEKFSTLYIQGQSGYLDFVEIKLPELYKEVRNILPDEITFNKPEETGVKRKRARKPSMMIECDKCPKMITNSVELKNHKLSNHTGDYNLDKRRKVPLTPKPITFPTTKSSKTSQMTLQRAVRNEVSRKLYKILTKEADEGKEKGQRDMTSPAESNNEQNIAEDIANEEQESGQTKKDNESEEIVLKESATSEGETNRESCTISQNKPDETKDNQEESEEEETPDVAVEIDVDDNSNVGVKKNQTRKKCYVCGKTFISKQRLKVHRNRYHPLIFSNLQNPNIKCDESGKTLKLTESIKSHKKTPHSNRQSGAQQITIPLPNDQIADKIHNEIRVESTSACDVGQSNEDSGSSEVNEMKNIHNKQLDELQKKLEKETREKDALKKRLAKANNEKRSALLITKKLEEKIKAGYVLIDNVTQQKEKLAEEVKILKELIKTE